MIERAADYYHCPLKRLVLSSRAHSNFPSSSEKKSDARGRSRTLVQVSGKILRYGAQISVRIVRGFLHRGLAKAEPFCLSTRCRLFLVFFMLRTSSWR